MAPPFPSRILEGNPSLFTTFHGRPDAREDCPWRYVVTNLVPVWPKSVLNSQVFRIRLNLPMELSLSYY